MDDNQLLRYSRHILLPQLGIEGQEKFRRSHALIIGAGGLGSPAALYLASAGVGTLTICDGDVATATISSRSAMIAQARIKSGLRPQRSAIRPLGQTIIIQPSMLTTNAYASNGSGACIFRVRYNPR